MIKKEILPVYCFDPLVFNASKIGLVRAKFLIESVENLRANLKKIGSNLLVSFEKPEGFIEKFILHDENALNLIVYTEEISQEEIQTV